MPFLSLFLYAFVASFTPGPNNLMALLHANEYGFKKTFKFCLGVGAGFFLVILLSCYFNLLLRNVLPKIEFVMMILGAVYMLYLAIKIMTSKNMDQDNEEGNQHSFFTGMLLQFVNPKGILYGITVISTFILPNQSSNFSLFLYSIILAFVGFMGTFSWSMFGSLFKKFLSKYRTPFNVVMALLLVISAVSIFVE